MSLGEALRLEAKRRYESGDIKLAATAHWLKAADFIDTLPQGPHLDSDAFAEALRYENTIMNGHPVGEWPDIPENHRDLWMRKVERMQKAIKYVIERRSQ